MFEIFKHYRTGMKQYDSCHPPTVRSRWSAFTAEVTEFISAPSVAEAWDILHSFGRLVWRLTGIPLQWLAYPTVRKHGQQFVERGCIRSERNCEQQCCDRDRDKLKLQK